MDTVGDTPPNFGTVPVIEEPPDLVDLLTATKVINREIRNKELSLLEQTSVRFVLNELLDVALEVAAGSEDGAPPYPPEHVLDDLPY